ncbi:MAG: glycoside hydrolase family 97 protein [Flavobacteriaceae bacterium]|nr:glycoside hydrolase family 97 protein [Flavobacteriaceae bacterium]
MKPLKAIRFPKILLLWVFFSLLFGCQSFNSSLDILDMASPNQVNGIVFFVDKEGQPTYVVFHKDSVVIDTSKMAFTFKHAAPMQKGFQIDSIIEESHQESWEMPWGEQRIVENNYNSALVKLSETQSPYRKLNIYFRAYDDGVAYRFEFPKQEGIDSLIITDEHSQFKLTEDPTVWWIPGDWDIYEHLYTESKFSKINAISKRNHPDLGQTYIPENAVNTPVTMRLQSGVHLAFHEAALLDYAGMTLKVDTTNLSMESALVGSDRLGYKVKRALPFQTPWRSIQIADKATDLIASRLIENLNEPNKIGDVSWFKPKKYMGIWWEMHLGISTWDMEATQDMSTHTQAAKTGVKHGATTANAKKYIDFASKNNITGLLVEGWNTGWNHWIGFEEREGVFDFVTPYADYDLYEVVRYGKEKGVELIMHHETSAAPRTYTQQLDTAFALMKHLDIHAVKTGYVGKIIPKGEYHHGQWMVNHYQKVLETAAANQIAINAHEPIKGTGLRRTYPNEIAREGLRGQEFNAWASDGGNPPEHLPIVAFTRMLAGPIDFTPGVFDIGLPQKPDNQINTTLAQQLALYVVIYSPIQMACDLPENYEHQPAFQFIRDVGVDWEQTKILNGEVGDFVTIAREERGTGNWFLGSITDENERKIEIAFDFLEADKNYEVTLYKDATDAHFRKNPKAISIEKIKVDYKSKLNFHLAAGGGLAISLITSN